ncbi:MAG: sugar phosphorylase [Deltaproteobacteria bacterium]|nr:sugar phosphorylase [Deltaproteobacteria bacterium]
MALTSERKTEAQRHFRKAEYRYNQDPDYTRPLLEIPEKIRYHMRDRLVILYGRVAAGEWMPELERILKVHHAHKPPELIEAEKGYDPKERFTERDMVLITYGDMIHGEGKTPLSMLHQFVSTFDQGTINTLHLLPFFPYSSDRGFAVIDYRQVDPKLGTWEDIKHMEAEYDLMFDGVINHCSSRSRMFQNFINGDPLFQEFFIAYESPDDLTPDQRSKIFRPRTSDILTKFHTFNGPKWIWTTFSEDQIDLNFRNPAVLMAVIEGLLFYIRNGADILRLDAVTYIWADPGTECVHLPQTHEIVKLLRDVVETAAPGTALITETNVPHEDNISYFGNGNDEAHMVYNFALPPLVLYSFYREDATVLSEWARALKAPSETATFFNFLDSHDGIGLMGVREILAGEEIDFIIEKATENGAYISYKMTEHFTEEPYEINTTWWSALNRDNSDEPLALQVKRMAASRSISFVIQGVPGIYAHGASGTANDHELVKKTGVKRNVNRGVIDAGTIAKHMNSPGSKNALMRAWATRTALRRTRESAFHPHGPQHVLMISPDVFTVFRISPEGDQHLLAMTNVTGRETTLDVSLSEIGMMETDWYDIVNEKEWKAQNGILGITMAPYDILWLKPRSEIQK